MLYIMPTANAFKGGAMRRVTPSVRFATRSNHCFICQFVNCKSFSMNNLKETDCYALFRKMQQFRPGYTAPPPLFHYGGVPMNFRGNWEISRRDLPAPRFITMVTTDRDFLESDFDDYSAPSSRSLICCRVIAIIFMVLLVLRHTLPIIISGAGDYSLTLFTLLMLRTVGILLPIYIMVKAFTAIQRRRHHQDPRFSLAASDEESELPQLQQPHSRFIGMH
ncbi:hypothetical protein POUND7_020098 [Theobroma cacao]